MWRIFWSRNYIFCAEVDFRGLGSGGGVSKFQNFNFVQREEREEDVSDWERSEEGWIFIYLSVSVDVLGIHYGEGRVR